MQSDFEFVLQYQKKHIRFIKTITVTPDVFAQKNILVR